MRSAETASRARVWKNATEVAGKTLRIQRLAIMTALYLNVEMGMSTWQQERTASPGYPRHVAANKLVVP
jgi:hypothetical protein